MFTPFDTLLSLTTLPAPIRSGQVSPVRALRGAGDSGPGIRAAAGYTAERTAASGKLGAGPGLPRPDPRRQLDPGPAERQCGRNCAAHGLNCLGGSYDCAGL